MESNLQETRTQSDFGSVYYNILPLIKNKRVLHVECGKGYGASLFANEASQVVATDAGIKNIEYAAKKYNVLVYKNLSFIHTKPDQLSALTTTADIAIFFIKSNYDEAYLNNIIAGIKKSLDKNGILVVSFVDRHSEIKKGLGFHFDNFSVVNFNATAEQTSTVMIASDDDLLFEKLKSIGIPPEKLPSNQDQKLLRQQSQIAILNAEKSKLQQEAILLENQRTDYQSQLINSQAEKSALQSYADNLKNEIKVLKEELEASQVSRQEAVKDFNKIISAQQNEIEKLKKEKPLLPSGIDAVNDELKQRNDLVKDLQFNLSLTQKQLSEVNEKLVTIYNSDGWKMLERYYRLKGKLMPEESKQYLFFKKALNLLRYQKAVPHASVDAKHEPGNNQEQIIEKLTLPYFQNPVVSIIVPVYNAWQMNAKCVHSIFENTKDVSYEIIIADDCSTDETKNIADFFTNIVHIRNEKNLGFLLNCNNAATHARGKYLHFLNNDTEVKAGWLSSLVNLAESDPSIGLIGSKLIYPDGRLQEAGGIIWNDASGWNFGHNQNADMPEFNYVKEVDYLSGASLLISKKLWNETGGFDERYSPAYCEDSDLAFEVRKRGFKVMYQPLSEVIHYEGYSHGSDNQTSDISSIKEFQAINNKKFFEKWKPTLKRDQFTNGENVFWAMDRSRHKKTILMVDHYVPQFDKDAGSRTTFQYLQLFLRLGFNVKFLGENFYKHEPYTTILQQMGIEVLYGPWYANNWKKWFKENSEKFDYVYLNRPHISINFIDFFKQHSTAKILYYGHDLHFLREQKRYELEKDSAMLEQIEKWKRIETYLFDKSDIILTPSVDEQKVIQSLNPNFNVQLMRPYVYKTVNDPVTNFHERNNLLFVGGFGHLPNGDGVLWFVNEIWPLITARIPGIKLIVAGSNPPPEIKDLETNNIIIKGFVADDELERLYATSKIAVIPLRYGAGVKGKTVEAMRYGLPLITTAFGVEGLPGGYSFLEVANTSKEFAEAVLKLYPDEEMLSMLSKKSVEYIQNNFSEKVAEDIINNALATVSKKSDEVLL